MNVPRPLPSAMIFFGAVILIAACSGGSAEQVGQPCTTASSCYPTLDAAALQGTATCLTQITGGYCTHTCGTDADCCAVPGECKTGFKEICAPFENQTTTYCFLSCEGADIAASGSSVTDPTAYCQKYAGPSFTCRSTGGGANNRQFCG
jgi:hypothetical protein